MAGVNKVIILGNMAKDPELKEIPGGTALCEFTLVTSRKNKAGEEIASWHRLKAFSKKAELIHQYVKKGQQLYVEGELQYGQYEKDGITRYTTDIVVWDLNFINSGGGKSEGKKKRF
ncbi:single-stranded DNA-binding protein [Pseudoalteromonas sp.]|uniref:single-stranded DNA-binding protein n=1 Tax=Pseudoalteromonas sp. TaxID=53249 RepID=UPI00260A817E|nr:single-stranded DNA-binding protein [Pseudoalteromonas sp.]MCP4585362.1 single-stranded DNA-binding protein [Pseudoalteromonas sp.]